MRTRERYRTQFCFIAPGSLLDRYASVSRTHLVLPQVDNHRYKEFYFRKRTEGDLIILDNGAYELGESDSYGRLTERMMFYNPQVTAMPDFLLQNGEKTFEECLRFRKELIPHMPKTKWMYIPQSTPGDMKGFMQWMNKAIKELKPDWIGLPRALVTDIGSKYSRVNVCEYLQVLHPEIKIHCLGMANGDLEELELLFWEGASSIDSGAPIWRGYHGSFLDKPEDQLRWNVYGKPVDFDYATVMGAGLDAVIKHNMNLVLRALGQKEIL